MAYKRVPRQAVLRLIFATLLSLGLSGVAQAVAEESTDAGSSPSAAAAEDVGQRIRERAGARWEALIARDFDRAYGFESPAYRKVYTPERYKSRFGRTVAWKAARVVGAQISGAVAKASVEITYATVSGNVMDAGLPSMDVTSVIEETWVREDENWWHVFN